jgi:hypothetical protein
MTFILFFLDTDFHFRVNEVILKIVNEIYIYIYTFVVKEVVRIVSKKKVVRIN